MISSTASVRAKPTTIDQTKLKKDHLTTTELAKLCGVSRFTIWNWIKQQKIKAVRTVGGQYRIPASEAISFLEILHLETSHKAWKSLAPGALGHCWEYPEKTNCDNRCRDCLIHRTDVDYCFIVVRRFGKGVIRCQGDCLNCDYFAEFFGFYNESSQAEKPYDEKSKKTTAEKKSFLYNFAYGVGRSVHVLKRKE
ncbi:MAG: MerR family transcriptional regulator [Planctomycetota bacterium]|jgi:excisionase family DNA binding protein